MRDNPKQGWPHGRASRWVRGGLAAIGLLVLAGCETAGTVTNLGPAANVQGSSGFQPGVPAGQAAGTAIAAAQTAGGNVPGELRLSPGDKIKVIVFGEDKISGDYEIDSAGFVSVPLGGTLKASGLTKRELEAAFTKKLKGEFLRDPKVTVDISSFRPFYVVGEVEKQGEYPYRSGLNVMTAIAIAGGATYRANSGKVLVQRAGEAALKEYPLSASVLVFPGDLIRVPERYF